MRQQAQQQQTARADWWACAVLSCICTLQDQLHFASPAAAKMPANICRLSCLAWHCARRAAVRRGAAPADRQSSHVQGGPCYPLLALLTRFVIRWNWHNEGWRLWRPCFHAACAGVCLCLRATLRQPWLVSKAILPEQSAKCQAGSSSTQIHVLTTITAVA